MGTTPVFRNRAWAAAATGEGTNDRRNYQRAHPGRPTRAPAKGPATQQQQQQQQQTSNLRGRCDVCRAKLALLGRKRTCAECGKTVCPLCLRPGPSLMDGPRCKRCHLLANVPQEANRLMEMHVKELRTILDALGVASDTCCEKSELVELVMHWRMGPDPVPVPVPVPPDTEPDQAPDPDPDSMQAIDENEPETTPLETPPLEEPTEVAIVAAGGRRLNIRDLEREEDIEALTVQQLKGLLLRASVDYRGCCEKWELVERTKRLWRETRDNACALKEDDVCRICMDAPIDCVLLECGHMATCTACGRTMNECPFCRQYVVRAVHIFRA